MQLSISQSCWFGICVRTGICKYPSVNSKCKSSQLEHSYGELATSLSHGSGNKKVDGQTPEGATVSDLQGATTSPVDGVERADIADAARTDRTQ